MSASLSRSPEITGGFVTPSGRPRWQPVAATFGVLCVLGLTMRSAGLDPQTVSKGLPALWDSAKAFVAPPDWSSLDMIAKGLEETVEMAIVGTVLAIPISFLLGLLCARNTSLHPALAVSLKSLITVGRGIPWLAWAMMIVAMAGLGVLPGVLALAISSTLFTSKLYAEYLEVVPTGLVEGVLVTGGGWLDVRRWGIVPQAATDILSQTLFTFEGNLRLATALGIVGAGGIGFELQMAIRNQNYGRVLVMMAAIYLLVSLVDRGSQWVRKRLV